MTKSPSLPLYFFPKVDKDSLLAQSFVVAVVAMVIATFSTGIDSQCFQVCSALSKYFIYFLILSFRPKHSWQQLQLRKDKIEPDDVPYGYGFFHFVFATGAMYFAMLLIGWNTHHAMKKYVSPIAYGPIHWQDFKTNSE